MRNIFVTQLQPGTQFRIRRGVWQFNWGSDDATFMHRSIHAAVEHVARAQGIIK